MLDYEKLGAFYLGKRFDESADKLTDDQQSAILTQVPAGRMGEADEIAAAVLYLASPEAGYVTGATLHVNGGMAML